MEKMILMNTVTIPDVTLMVIVKIDEIRFVKNVAEFNKRVFQFDENALFAIGKSAKKVFIFSYKVLM